MNELYNYKTAFNEPIRIKQVTDRFTMPFFINLSNLVIYGIVFFLMCILWKLIFHLLGYRPLLIIYVYLTAPYLVSKHITKINPCGKKLHFYLYDLLIYLKSLIFKEKYCHGKKIRYIGKTYKFNV